METPFLQNAEVKRSMLVGSLIKPVFCPSCSKKQSQPSLCSYFGYSMSFSQRNNIAAPHNQGLAGGHHFAQHSNPDIINEKRETVSR